MKQWKLLIALLPILSLVACSTGLSLSLNGEEVGEKEEAQAEEKTEAPVAKAEEGTVDSTTPAPAESASAESAPAAPAPAAPAEPVAPTGEMGKLKLVAAPGWGVEFNKIMSSWTLEKYVPEGDGTNALGGRFYVDPWDGDKPAKAAAYADKLKTKKGFQDMGYIWTKAEVKEVPGGWMVFGVSIDKSDAEASPEDAFIFSINGYSCRGSTFKTKALYEEAVAACQSIQP